MIPYRIVKNSSKTTTMSSNEVVSFTRAQEENLTLFFRFSSYLLLMGCRLRRTFAFYEAIIILS